MNTNDLTNLILKTVRSSRKNEASKVLARTIKGESDSKSAPVFECLNMIHESFEPDTYKLGDDVIIKLTSEGDAICPYTIYITDEQALKFGDYEKDYISNVLDDPYAPLECTYYFDVLPYVSDKLTEEDLTAGHIEKTISIAYEGVDYPTKTIVDVELPEEPEDPYEYVDLGLPSGTLWATCNVGANSPEEDGLYFQWGDTEGHAKDSGYVFNNDNYKAKGLNTISTDLTLEQDAANANMGGDWRMPTKEEFKELYDNTDREWTNLGGINGYKFINKSDATKWVFFTAAGYCNGTSLNGRGSYGRYSSASFSGSSYAYNMGFDSSDVLPQSVNTRYYGIAVRAVKSSN